MKKLLLIVMVMIGQITAYAVTNYSYLVFVTTDDTSVAVPVESLSISFSGTTLTAGDKSFELSNLKKMYFSASGDANTVKPITAEQLDDVIAVYDLKGHSVPKSQMQKRGVYVVKTNKGTYKIAVK